jgi:hypothetical protein
MGKKKEIQQIISKITEEVKGEILSESQIQEAKKYAIEDYPRLVQLARAGLVPEDRLFQMLYFLKDPKRFGVSPKVRNQLYDVLIKTLNYLVASDPAAWARFRIHLMKETDAAEEIAEMKMSKKDISEEFKSVIRETRREMGLLKKVSSVRAESQRRLEEAAKREPGTVWETENSWAGKNRDGESVYWSKAEHGESAKEKATAFSRGKMSAAQAKAEKAQAGKEAVKQAIKKNVETGAAKKIASVKPSPEYTGPKSPENALGSDPKTERKIATRLDKIAQVMQERFKTEKKYQREFQAQGMEKEAAKKAAKEKTNKELGESPNFDLCKVSVPGTNLYCGDNLGIPRKKMPQLKTPIVAGSQAEKDSKLPASDPNHLPVKDGEANAEKKFLEHLKGKGVKVAYGKSMAAAEMKATQMDLVGEKVMGMVNGLKAGKAKRESDACGGTDPVTKQRQCKDASGKCGSGNCGDEGLLEPLIMSKDGYILDGHHRWAAIATLDLMDGRKEPFTVNTTIVDMEMEDLVDESNEWGDEYGLERKSGKATDKAKETKKEERESTAGEQLHESLTKTIEKILREELAKYSMYA